MSIAEVRTMAVPGTRCGGRLATSARKRSIGRLDCCTSAVSLARPRFQVVISV